MKFSVMSITDIFDETQREECRELIHRLKKLKQEKEAKVLESYYKSLTSDLFSDMFCGTPYIATLNEYHDYVKHIKEKLGKE